MTLPILRLKSNSDRRIRGGHLWVFSNEVDTTQTPLTALEAGQEVQLLNASGKPLGLATVTPDQLICARLHSRDSHLGLDKSLLVHRLNIALSLRERLFDKPFYRLVHGESDLLPGLVVDRFADQLLVQISTPGMQRVRGQIIEALVQVLKPAGILLSQAGAVEALYGELPPRLALEENGVRFDVAPVAGWDYVQRANRARLAPYVAGGRRVLDLYSGIGDWAVQAAVFGAGEVFCIGRSAAQLDQLEHNAGLNGVAQQMTLVEGELMAALGELKEAGEKFDLVIVAPPALINRRKDIRSGGNSYRRINEQAMRLLSRDGVLVSTSRSLHLTEASLRDTLLAASRHLDRQLVITERGGQGPDCPVHPAIAETDCLKALYCRVLPV